MNKGQMIRLRPSSRAGLEWRIPREAVGTVLCRYRIYAGSPRATELIDVRFNAETVIWGAPAAEFEEVALAPRREASPQPTFEVDAE